MDKRKKGARKKEGKHKEKGHTKKIENEGQSDLRRERKEVAADFLLHHTEHCPLRKRPNES